MGCQRRSVGMIMGKMKYYRESEERNILHPIKRMKAHSIGYILHRTAFYHMLLKEREGKTEVTKDKEEEISSYWTVLMKQDARNLKRKH